MHTLCEESEYTLGSRRPGTLKALQVAGGAPRVSLSALWVMLPNSRTRCCWESPLLPAPSPRSAPALDPDGPGTVLWAFASLVGQEHGSGLAGWLRLRVSHEVAFKVSAGRRSSEGLTWDAGSPSTGAHSHGRRVVLSVHWGLRFSPCGLSIGLSSILTTWRLAATSVISESHVEL